MHAGHGADRRLRGEHALRVQLVGEHVQQHFAVRVGVDVAAVGLEHLLAQRLGGPTLQRLFALMLVAVSFSLAAQKLYGG